MNNYGANGSNEVWGASLEEVWEYQIMRLYSDFEVVNVNEQAGYVELSLNLTKIPGDMRRYALSLQANDLVSSVELINCEDCNVCFGANEGGSIINLDLTGSDIIAENSVEQIANVAPALLFPNPTSNAFEIKDKRATNIEIFNMNGQSLIQQVDASKAISVEALEAGIYLVQYEIDGHIIHSRLSVQ